MQRIRFGVFGLLIGFASIAGADPVRTLLPNVSDVYVDFTGRAIQETAGGDWRASAGAVVAGKTGTLTGAKVLLVDHQHRLWLRPDSDKAAVEIQMYDGKTWLTRRVADIPADGNRKPDHLHFVGPGVEDAAGDVWFADGDASQGWWLHQFTPAGQWMAKALHERTLAAKKPGVKTVAFAEPRLLAGPDGLFYASWSSTRIDHGQGMGASGFVQYDGSHWSEYFYPTGSVKTDNVQSIIPLPDGSVGFVRQIDEPRVVWMTSALSRPAPDLTPYLDRLSSLSAPDRESAQAELIAMGPRIRKALEAVAADTRDPEIQSRIPTILQEISKPPMKGVYGGKLTFTSWRLLHIARSGRVYLAVKNCKDQSNGATFAEALVTVSPEGLWTAAESPTKAVKQPIDALDLYEDAAGRRWYRIAKAGVFLDDGKSAPQLMGDAADAEATVRGVDADGQMYLFSKSGVIVLSAK